MENKPFRIDQVRPLREGMTISRSAHLGRTCGVTWFSLGRDTSISRESYDTSAFYLGADGLGTFLLGEVPEQVGLGPGQLLAVPGGTLCGAESKEGTIYTEIITGKEVIMNNVLKSGQAIDLKELITYEEGSIANLDLVKNDTMKFVLMAFDEGTGLQPHRAPGNAIVTALEGSAVIGYEGTDHQLNAGECFRFDKNGLHSVTAQGRFKMSLLLVIE